MYVHMVLICSVVALSLLCFFEAMLCFVAGVHGLLSGANGGLLTWGVLMLCVYYAWCAHLLIFSNVQLSVPIN